ncbi:hypothetical protein ACP4OV_002180 [Aristida adscensionis]
MAAVLNALAPFLINMIKDMPEEEVRMLLGVSGEIEKLGDKVANLEAYMADAERRRITDSSVQGWVTKLKGAMYDATDTLELCKLEAEERQDSHGGCWKSMEEKAPGCLQPLLFCLRNPAYAHRMGRRIKDLNTRLDQIRKEMVDFGFVKLEPYQLRTPPSDATPPSRTTTSLLPESAAVGDAIERETNALVQELLLVADEPAIKVVSIVGMGGIGKTTLAKKIFNEKDIQAEFKSKIWLSVTESYKEDQLLSSSITQAGGEPRGDKQVLSHTLTRMLSTGKFLLVMDDVWSNTPWADVLKDPVLHAASNQPGSRVIITTRNEGIVQRMGLRYYYQHHVKEMCDEDAWSLLKQQLSGQELDHPIYLSYADLTPQLKQCFLYCILFPKGTSIWMVEAIRIWISEGFINPQEGCSSHNDRLEEVATRYYRELITRNLIEPTPTSTMTGYECTMHDVIRSFAEFMAREESLVILGEQAAGGHDNSLMRHLSIGSTESLLEWATLQKHKSLRTLILHSRINLKPHDSLSSFSSLRVLRIKYADCDRFIESLCQLKHLRYLQQEETNISKLPDDIHRLKFLQHMVLNRCSNLDHLPSSITKLVHLRTLIIKYYINLVPKGLGGLTNLRMLKGFPVHMDMDGDWCSLEEIGSLSQLRDLTIKGLENVTASSFAEKAVISNKRYLSYLEMNCTGSRSIGLGDEMEQKQQVIEEVYDKLCPPICIETLAMQGYFGRRLPNWMSAPATAAFTSLRFLQFMKLSCCTKLLDGLCQLPCLEGFRIEGAPAIERVGHQFQAPFSLVVGGGATAASAAFPKLRVLNMVGLSEWEEWEWEEQGGEDAAADTIAMPSLENLGIDNCKLSCLPPGLANSKRHALRELRLCRITNLTSVENFPSVVDLEVFDCPELRRINCLSRLQKIRIIRCPKVEVLEDVPVLDTLKLEDATMETLPGYLRGVSPQYLELVCSKELYETILLPGSSEGDKISHIKKHKIYWLGEDED